MSVNREDINIVIPLFNSDSIASIPQNNQPHSQTDSNTDFFRPQIETFKEQISKVQLNFSKKTSKLNKTKSIFLESEFPTENNTFVSHPKNWTKFDSLSSEFGLKFLLRQAMSSMHFRLVKKISIAERYQEIMHLQKMLSKKLGYETNVDDIRLDNEEYHRDALSATAHHKPETIRKKPVYSQRDAGTLFVPKEIKARKNSFNSEDAHPISQSMRNLQVSESMPKKVRWLDDFQAKSIQSISAISDPLKVESPGQSSVSGESHDSAASVYKQFMKLKENFLNQSGRSLKSFSRIIGIYRNRKSLNILTHKDIRELDEPLWEIEVSCARFLIKEEQSSARASNPGLVCQNIKWKIRRTKTDFQNLRNVMIESGILRPNEASLGDAESPGPFLELLDLLVGKKQHSEKISLFHSFLGLSVLNFQETHPSRIFQFAANLNATSSLQWSWRRRLCGDFWVRRWMFINDRGLGIIKQNKLYSKISKFYFFSNRFRLSIRKTKVKLRFDNCYLEVDFASELMVLEFVRTVYQKLIRTEAALCNRFLSFSNPTTSNRAVPFLNANDYFGDLHSSLAGCRSTLDIIGWGLSPFIFLKRPVCIDKVKHIGPLGPRHKKKMRTLGKKERLQNEFSRLDMMLLFLAKKGVKVRIILYHESAVGLGIDSELAKEYLESLSANIQVILLREHFFSYWVVHEKVVVVDGRVVYLGGIDLINGRFDDGQYSLFEFGDSPNKFFPGNDFSNVYQNKKRNAFDATIQNQNGFHRMPFRDVQTRFEGPVVREVSQHFAQMWQHSYDDQSYYQKKYLSSLYSNKVFSQNLRLVSARMKHRLDIRHLYSSSAFSPFAKHPSNANADNVSFKRSESFHTNHESTLKQFLIQSRINSIYRNARDNQSIQSEGGSLRCQVFRSVSRWSMGHEDMATERSAYYKVVDMILTSKKFLYMENQFFMSNYMEAKNPKGPGAQLGDFYFTNQDALLTRTTRARVHNRVIEALYQRIKRAFDEREPFICCLVLNLMPDFFGNLNDKMDKFRIVMDVTLNSLNQGKFGLIRRLKEGGIPWKNYLKIFGLKNHGKGPDNEPKCESIYVHSKVIIQDDHEMLVGSVNLNDRSLLGTRDSELAVSLVDEQKVPGSLGGEVYEKSKQIVDFRKKMMASLIGDSRLDLDDFLSPDLWMRIENQARINEKFYLEVFGHFLDNHVKRLTDIEL